MTALIIGIVVYLLTIVAYLYVEVRGLKEEQAVVTVEDVVKGCEFFYFIPVYNTIVFIVILGMYVIWEVCKFGKVCKWVWNKIKDIKL